MSLQAEGLTRRQIAELLGLTLPAVQRAINLDRKMKELGITDPYVPVLEPPADCKKLRRYRHPRYRFEPLTEGSDASLVIPPEPPTVSLDPLAKESATPPETDAEAA